MQIIPVRLEKEKFKTIKETLQNKFAELDYREEDTDYVLCALQEIIQELGEKKHASENHENCEHCDGEEKTFSEMLEEFIKTIRK